MKRFAVNKTLAVSASAATNTMPIGIQASATRSFAIYDLVCGANNAVADAQVLVGLTACSTYVAGTAFTSTPLEMGDAASSSTATTTLTVGSQVLTGTPLIELAFNTRATVRWVAVDPDSRIMVPAGANATGSIIMYNQQPGTVAGLILDNNLYFVE